jgi:hypothetical protein
MHKKTPTKRTLTAKQSSKDSDYKTETLSTRSHKRIKTNREPVVECTNTLKPPSKCVDGTTPRVNNNVQVKQFCNIQKSTPYKTDTKHKPEKQAPNINTQLISITDSCGHLLKQFAQHPTAIQWKHTTKLKYLAQVMEKVSFLSNASSDIETKNTLQQINNLSVMADPEIHSILQTILKQHS